MICHYTLSRMSKIKKASTIQYWRRYGRHQLSFTRSGSVNWRTNTLKTVWQYLLEEDISIHYDPEIPLLGIYATEVDRKMLLEALFIKLPNGNNPKSWNKWINWDLFSILWNTTGKSIKFWINVTNFELWRTM